MNAMNSRTAGNRITRREYLRWSGAAALSSALSSALSGCLTFDPLASVEPKRIAAIITHYTKRSHADVIAGKILRGWKQDGGPGPNLRLVSMYVEQFPEGDMSRALSKEFNVPLFDNIPDAVSAGSVSLAADGVLIIGEHGSYPWNEKGQHLYPRRRFFTEVTETFRKFNRIVPVFNDKHLGPQWEDARWMYERAQAMKIPMMAGSSLPVSFRTPEVVVPRYRRVRGAVAIGYSGLDVYGIHALEVLQSVVERRTREETGVAWVQCLGGDDIWKAVDSGAVDREIFEAALAVTPKENTDVRSVSGDGMALFLFEYNDGTPGALFMLPGYARGCSCAVKVKGVRRPLAFHAEERREPRYPHFAYLLHALERMFHTGRPTYPVERTLLTGGILDRALTSRHEGGRRLKTPELSIRYPVVVYPHAPLPRLTGT